MSLEGIDILVDRGAFSLSEVQRALAVVADVPEHRVIVVDAIEHYPSEGQLEVICVVSEVEGRFETLLAVDGPYWSKNTDIKGFVSRLSGEIDATFLVETGDANPYAMWLFESGGAPVLTFLSTDAADEGRYELDPASASTATGRQEIQKMVSGTISRVEHYGLYVETEVGPAIVLIPDVSEAPVRFLQDVFSAGDTVRLELIRFVEERQLYKGTMLGIEQPPKVGFGTPPTTSTES